MKYCANCGAQLADNITFCTNCGANVSPAEVQQNDYANQQNYNQPNYNQANYNQPYNQPVYNQQVNNQPPASSGLVTAAKVFMIIGTVCMTLWCFFIPLAWCLPMTISYFNKIKNNQPISTAFKVCSLLFVNTIAGILMLCDKEH